MKYQKVIDTEQKSVGMVATKWFTDEPSRELQLQIEQDGDDAFIDLSIDEVKLIVVKLNEFLNYWETKSEETENDSHKNLKNALQHIINSERPYSSAYKIATEALLKEQKNLGLCQE